MAKKYKELLAESGLSRIWAKVQKHTAGSITGFRGDNTRRENLDNNREIKAFLRSKGYSVTKVMGNYIENKGSENENEAKEESFFVVNDSVEGWDDGQLESDLFKLGVRFDQDSVLIVPPGGEGAYLLGTSKREDSFPDFKQKEEVGNGRYGKFAGEFLSRIQGRAFAFENVEMPKTINGIRGWKILAEKIEDEMNYLDEEGDEQ